MKPRKADVMKIFRVEDITGDPSAHLSRSRMQSPVENSFRFNTLSETWTGFSDNSRRGEECVEKKKEDEGCTVVGTDDLSVLQGITKREV